MDKYLIVFGLVCPHSKDSNQVPKTARPQLKYTSDNEKIAVRCAMPTPTSGRPAVLDGTQAL